MKDTLSEINLLRSAGLIGKWAIGGAMGATFYLEPISTYDLDIFVLFEGAPLILTLSPIYDFLKVRGHMPDGDALMVCGWPVQFLPAESALLSEAVEAAREVDFEGVPAYVMTAEHLMAISLQTGRGKDFARLVTFMECRVANEAKLREILERHGLLTAWKRFEQNYLNPL
ncbi:hypothetical protein [Prosthecobacter vanneervenii]|uniref:Nucleotidyltransferase n=1 Tax=Prosthecobacter vanneervenii TaxID=48466 RepID=A0A7W7Y828_9BACT|nr:hypothetical protein [Prosthecobacter vanneervenii]MBB5031316.1 hypothetical protein [Prosthecobacter vanneervenii]